METAISVKNLTKKFKDFVAVDNISFEVNKGDIFAFLGPNGAGKTTTIKMITTLLRSNGGEIKVKGMDPLEHKDEVRKSFGVVFQDTTLDDELTAWENMYFHAVLYNVPKAEREEKIKDLLEFVELYDRKKDYVKKFSGGMKRRLEIARGLLHLPDILFLDEPTLGLDAQTRNKIWNFVKELKEKRNITVFLTSHYLQEAESVADKVAIIDHGKIIFNGSPADVKQQTNTDSLEDAFLELTGKDIREETASGKDQMRRMVGNSHSKL